MQGIRPWPCQLTGILLTRAVLARKAKRRSTWRKMRKSSCFLSRAPFCGMRKMQSVPNLGKVAAVTLCVTLVLHLSFFLQTCVLKVCLASPFAGDTSFACKPCRRRQFISFFHRTRFWVSFSCGPASKELYSVHVADWQYHKKGKKAASHDQHDQDV